MAARSAGLRTTTLVATGAAAFADMGLRPRGVEGATQIIAYIVSGIGFLGAGVILKDGTNVRGLRGCLETPARVLNLGKSVESKRSPIAGAFDVDCRDPGRA